MKSVRLKNGVVAEIIPDYALPVAKWYGEAFAAQCREAPDEVEQHWACDPQTGTFSPPEPKAEPEMDAVPAMADVFALARMQAQALPNAMALTVPTLYPPWTVGASYGQQSGIFIVSHGDRLYRLIDGKDHTAQAGWEPGTVGGASLWAGIDRDHAGTMEDPITAARGMEYAYGLYYLDPEDGKVYLCRREGEEAGATVVLQFLPHELAGQYFEEVVT